MLRPRPVAMATDSRFGRGCERPIPGTRPRVAGVTGDVGPGRLPGPRPGGARRLPRRAGRAAATAGSGRRAAASPRPVRRSPAARGSGRRSAGGGTSRWRRPADDRRAGPGLRLARAAARQRARARRLHGRLGQPSGPAVDAPHLRARAPRRRVARRPGAVRRGRRDPPRRPAAVVVRRAAAPLRAAAGGRRPGARGVRPVPHRGDRRPVPRRLGPGPRPRRRRHRDDGAALQVGQVLHRAAAAPRRRAGRRARRRRWPS